MIDEFSLMTYYFSLDVWNTWRRFFFGANVRNILLSLCRFCFLELLLELERWIFSKKKKKHSFRSLQPHTTKVELAPEQSSESRLGKRNVC